ncbi:AGC family protein kinase [Histomonas meleagridis]|uniref:AGC family protein kinase n=1 Tax=Histomonas meleagridis TaxID=135588 RepID=UPI00355A3F62|nr:AGC family protein kinase [Histomonas meleagridis]KAH0800054.1 AGC family protein kinase [Histomonas meleagridis]
MFPNYIPGFTFIKQLGKGSYGAVYKVKRIQDNQNYALKIVDLRSLNQIQREESVNEIRILASVHSPFIIGFHEASIYNKKLCIVTEYGKLGDLSHAISRRKAKRRPFKEDEIWRFLLQSLHGLQVLHNRGIIHRDIKSANILMCAPDLFKIGDLGISTVLKQHRLAKTQIGTPIYLAPEIWKKKPYNDKCDVWSLGVVLYEMATFTFPYNGSTMRELQQKVCNSRIPRLPNYYSKDLSDIIHLMLRQNPALRPNVSELLAMPIINSRMSLITPFLNAVSRSDANLIETIRVPQNLQYIHFPVPRYQKDECVSIDKRLHAKGKMVNLNLNRASTRELQMIADLDQWSPTKNKEIVMGNENMGNNLNMENDFCIKKNEEQMEPKKVQMKPRPPPRPPNRANPRKRRILAAQPKNVKQMPARIRPQRPPLIIW